MANIDYKVIKDYGTVADHDGLQLKLQMISWSGHPAKLDLRCWRNGYAMGGITMNKDEIKTLGDLIDGLNIKPKAKVDKNKTTTIVKVEDKEEEKKDNIIKFPKPKPDIEKMVTDGSSTYEECEEKLGEYKKVFADADSQYVIDGLLELCKVDADFRNNVMREDKTFGGAFDYMAKMCKEGYGYMSGKGDYGIMDRDTGLGFTIDYFNLKPESKPEPKVKVETKKQEPKKRGRKRKVV